MQKSTGLVLFIENILMASIIFFTILKALQSHSLNSYAITILQLDYSHGFIKRGLIGSLLPDSPSYLFVFGLINLSFSLITIFLIFYILKQYQNLIVIILFSPFIESLSRMIGSVDQFLFLLTTLLIILPPRIFFIVVIPISSIMILIHEGFLLMFAPIICFKIYLINKNNNFSTNIALYFLIYTFCLTLIESSFGNNSTLPPEYQSLQSPLIDNIKYYLDYLFNLDGWIYWLTLLLLYLPNLFYSLLININLLRQNSLPTVFCLIPLSPLSLTLLGTDYSRWFYLSCLNNILFSILFSLHFSPIKPSNFIYKIYPLILGINLILTLKLI